MTILELNSAKSLNKVHVFPRMNAEQLRCRHDRLLETKRKFEN